MLVKHHFASWRVLRTTEVYPFRLISDRYTRELCQPVSVPCSLQGVPTSKETAAHQNIDAALD